MPGAMQLAELARRACESEVRIVTLLLDMSRLQSGLPIVSQQACEIDSVLRTAIADTATVKSDLTLIMAEQPSFPSQRR